MTVAELGQLEFRGEDAMECELFINAVSRHALSIGKQRDDQWVADSASSCFTHDALRWWDRLDDETQGSWRLLRKAMLSRYTPLFHGESGEEAEKFVHMVRKRAFDEGKPNDNGWIIGFTSTCFVGDALRWHASLEPRVRTDWIRLEGALLAQYPRDPQGNLPNLIPTPAAAAATTPGIGVVSAPRTTRRGRIRVTKKGDSTRFYISKSFVQGIYLGLTCTDGGAMIVAWDWPCSDPQILTIQDPEGDSGSHDTVGVQWIDLQDSRGPLTSLMRATRTGPAVGGVKNAPFKGWKISESASNSGISFKLTARNEAGRNLYAASCGHNQNIILLPHVPYVALSLSLESI